MRILAALLLAPLALGSPPAVLSPARPTSIGWQDPAPDAELPPLLRLKKEREKFLSEGVLGCWVLDGYSVNGLATPADDIRGNALFCDGYLSLVINAIGYDEVISEEVPIVQAGIFRYRVDEFGSLQTSTVIGHSNPFGDLEYDEGGGLREYTLDLDQLLLTLRHQNGTVLTFVRMEESAFSAVEMTRLSQLQGTSSDVPEDSDDDPEDETPPSGDLEPLLEFFRAQQASVEQGIKGSWQLLEYVVNGAEVPEGEIIARALFYDGYSALVIQAMGFDEIESEVVPLAQAGLFRYRIEDGAKLQTSTIIGHANVRGDFEWEDDGELREYSITFEKAANAGADLLTLRHEDGTTMRFGRTPPGEITQREIDRLNEIRGLGYDTSLEENEEER